MTNIAKILTEKKRAESLYPIFPADPIHMLAVMAEESGEAVRAALNMVYHGGSVDEVRKELVQTGAMVLRCLEGLEGE